MTDTFLHESDPRARGRRHGARSRQRRTHRHVDRRQLVLRLNRDAAELRQPGFQPGEDLGGRGDGIPREEAAPRHQEPEGNGFVSAQQQALACGRRRQLPRTAAFADPYPIRILETALESLYVRLDQRPAQLGQAPPQRTLQVGVGDTQQAAEHPEAQAVLEQVPAQIPHCQSSERDLQNGGPLRQEFPRRRAFRGVVDHVAVLRQPRAAHLDCL